MKRGFRGGEGDTAVGKSEVLSLEVMVLVVRAHDCRVVVCRVSGRVEGPGYENVDGDVYGFLA